MKIQQSIRFYSSIISNPWSSKSTQLPSKNRAKVINLIEVYLCSKNDKWSQFLASIVEWRWGSQEVTVINDNAVVKYGHPDLI